MAGGPLIASAQMMRPAAAPAHLMPAAANPAFMQHQHQMAMMAMRPPFGALPGPAPGNYITSIFNQPMELGRFTPEQTQIFRHRI